MKLEPISQTGPLDERALDQLFREARTHNGWLNRPVPEALLREAVELAKMGPTSANTSPMRVVFVRSKEGKERLKPTLMPLNVEKTMQAPVTAIVGNDHDFPDLLPRLFPHADAKAWFVGNDAFIADTAYRNATLQGAYLFSRCARSVSIPARCPGWITRRSMRNSLPALRFVPTS